MRPRWSCRASPRWTAISDIGVGNIIGSNVANISLVLAAAAFVATIPVKSATVRLEAPISVASVLLFATFLQGELSRLEGAALGVLLVLALALVFGAARADDPLLVEVEGLVGDEEHSVTAESVRTLVGLVFVAGSAWFIVEGATRVADELELSGGFVGFTLVAVGTSAPELVTANRRGSVRGRRSCSSAICSAPTSSTASRSAGSSA